MCEFPKLSCALLALIGFGACGGESGQDLFKQGFGTGVVPKGGGSSSGPTGGVTFITGGSNFGGTPAQGGSLGAGGSSFSGSAGLGSLSGAGGRLAGGAAGAAGSLGGSTPATSGGRLGTGGVNAGGANCSGMRTELSSLLAQAQACSNSGSAQPCSGTVMTECGCLVPVSSATSALTQAYRNQFDMIVAACPKPACPDDACVDPTGATCMAGGSDMGRCVVN
jgi:hypothetical protein